MDFGNNKLTATVSQTLNPTNVKNMIEELHEITGKNEILMILCNPANYEFVKESLNSICAVYNIIKFPYVEENVITVMTNAKAKTEMLEFCKCKN